MFVNLIFNEVTQQYESSYPSAGAFASFVTETMLDGTANVFSALQTFGGGASITGVMTTNVDNIITTSTDGLVLQNTTPSTAGVPVQRSPRAVWAGTAYNSVSTLSEIRRWWWEVLPVTVAGTTSGAFNLVTNLNGGAGTQLASINDSGTLTLAQGLTLASLASLSFNTAGYITGGASTGLFLLRNVAATSGVGFDVNTDAVFKVRTRAQSAYATVDALGYSVGGAAGVSFGPAHPASITIVNGLVTACS